MAVVAAPYQASSAMHRPQSFAKVSTLNEVEVEPKLGACESDTWFQLRLG